MINNFSMLLTLAGTAGLGKLQANMVSNWIGPLFLMIIAGVSVKFLISRQFRELAGFLGIAAVVGLLVFNASGLFGTNGVFVKIANFFSGSLTDGGASTGSTGTVGSGMIEILKIFSNG